MQNYSKAFTKLNQNIPSREGCSKVPPENAPNYTSNKHKLKHFLPQSISCLYTSWLQHTEYIQSIFETLLLQFTSNFTIREFGKMALLYKIKSTIRVYKSGPMSSSGTLTLLVLDLGYLPLGLDLGWCPEPLP